MLGNALWRRQFRLRSAHTLLLTLLVMPPFLNAQESQDEVRRLARNPVADAIKVPLVQDIFFDTGPYSRTSNSLQIQPVIPLQISQKFLLVPRIVATALAYVPDVTQPSGGSTGLGDTILTFFVTPAQTAKLVWGIGPALLIPTATSADIGGGKWSLGPSFVLLTQPQWGSVGVLVQNMWSLPGHLGRASVNQIQIETGFSYNLPHGWYLVTAPTINADWTQPTGRRWLVPFGAGAGRAFDIGHQAVDSNLALYYNAIRPTGTPSPKWQLSLQLTLVYARQRKPTP